MAPKKKSSKTLKMQKNMSWAKLFYLKVIFQLSFKSFESQNTARETDFILYALFNNVVCGLF